MELLASDAQNPNFMGAHNPDSRLAVQFYSRLVQNDFETHKQQRPIHESMDFVKIMTPGDKLNIIDTYAREDHKNRFPIQWQAYKNRGDANTHIIGTPITDWPRISASQAEELRGLKFYTVEAIAQASDAQLQGIGMIAGMSAYTFRDDAKRFLSVAEAASKLTEADKRVAESEAKIKAMHEDFAAQQAANNARIDALLAALEAKAAATESTTVEVDTKRGPGRPKQEAA